ncbi:DinB family protein [Hymenobacter latericus]|uniref:DinB family protein n=1 Tax=Hymenobacter sp. YIM 151858-1 TaxID=2987688 RepID=UPI002225CC83|nr:DinB family protein [Hymenobacter sp. YIM 151858-1]UYZ58937.1 DinB family protein [Hymenobacter sp. YIM 151858-1]
MPELTRIIDQLQRAFDGDAWSGPSLQATLLGVSAAKAAMHPLPQAHSIWELVLHLTTWADTVRQRIEHRHNVPPVAADWPAAPATPTEAAWQQANRELCQAHERLVAQAQTLRDADLGQVLGTARDRADGSGVSIYVLLHGTAQHYLYHAGQIALLRKLL